MQNWQFYLHMLALCVIILLLYLFFREYKRHKAEAKPDAIAPTAPPPRPVHAPLSHAHLQAMQSLVADHKAAPSASHRFETESNLDRELAAELRDLDRVQGGVDAVDDVAHSDTSSESNRSTASASKDPPVAGSPIRQVIEFVPKKVKRRSHKAEAS